MRSTEINTETVIWDREPTRRDRPREAYNYDAYRESADPCDIYTWDISHEGRQFEIDIIQLYLDNTYTETSTNTHRL